MRQVGGDRPLKRAAHDLKPDAHDNVGRQLDVLHDQAPLSLRLGQIRLEIGANASGKLSRSLSALDHEPRPVGLRDRLLEELAEGEGYARDGIRQAEPGRRQQLVEALPSFSPTAAANSSMLWKW